MALKLIREFDNLEDAERVRIEDAIHTASKFGISLIPFAGPVLAEIMGFIFSSPFENRRSSYFKDLDERLQNLIDEDRLTIDDLKDNEDFMNVVINSIPMALRSFEDEKRTAFMNAILNTALRLNPNETKIQIFLRQLDSLTLAHIHILYLFSDPRRWFRANNVRVPETSSLTGVLRSAYPEIVNDSNLVNLIWEDLKIAGFHNSGGLMTMMTSSGTLDPRVSELGEAFIKFITFDDKI